MPAVSACPDRARYQLLTSGQMAPAEKEALLQHLEHCATCGRVVEALLAQDPLVEAVRQGRTRGEDSVGANIARLVERLSKLGPGATASAADAATLPPPPPAPAPMLTFACPACRKGLKVNAAAAGKKVQCPSCRQVVQAPEAPHAGGGQAAPPAGSEAPTLAPSDSTLPPPACGGKELYDFLAPAQGPDELGRLGHYRVLAVLGAGGMGVVFQADEPVLKRKVALKAMLPALAASETARQRFLREAQAAATVEHDHIVPIYYVGEDRGVPFIAMPFLKGEPLDVRLQRQGALPIPEVLRIGREAAQGLAAAHARGLIHRDVKPANLWLEGVGQTFLSAGGVADRNVCPTTGGRVKILDFGLARAAGGESNLTQQGAILGTPAYMAPEQVSGKVVDGRADLFSLGCVLYVMAAGKAPFQGSDTVSTLMAVATEQPSPPRAGNPQVPEALNDLILRLLAKDPADRPQSAREVVAALEAIERAAAPALSTLAMSPARPRRRRWMPAAVAAGLLAAAALAAVIVLHVKDDKGEGTVTIETVDPDIEVVVRGGGREFTIYDKKSRQEVTLPVGRYEVELKGGKDGLKLETGQFTLKRGDRAVVRVAWSPGKGPGRAAERGKGPRPALLDCTGPAGASAAEVRRAQAVWAKYLGRPVEETVEAADGVPMTFVLVPPGKFLMGSPANEKERETFGLDETLHEVTLTEPFDLGKTEVTQAQYKALTGVNPSFFIGDDLPVEQVNWEEARDCAARLTKQLGERYQYRLPTEAEWGYACRAGRPSSQPCGIGDGSTLSSRQANFNGEVPYGDADKGPNLKTTCRVGSYPANALGLFDMHGNVWEWCADWFGPYPRRPVTNPTGPTEGKERVTRGGSYGSYGRFCRAACRGIDPPGNRLSGIGFRLARSLPPGFQ